MTLNIFLGEVSGTNLLCDTTSFTGLHISLSELVKNQCLSSIYVTKDTDNWASQLLCLFLFLVSFLETSHVLLLT